MEFIEGNGLPHQCAHWFAMTVVFNVIRADYGAAGVRIFVSLRGGMKCRRGNPYPDKLEFEIP